MVKVYDHGKLAWQKSTSIPDYLCFTALEAGQFTLTIPAAVTPTYLSYVEWSKDGRTWNHTDNTSEAVTIDVQVASGEKVYWRGSGSGMAYDYSVNKYSVFSSTGTFDVGGDLRSLLFSDDFENVTTTNQRYCFTGLFYGASVVDASNLRLALTGNSAYMYCFRGCTQLLHAPALMEGNTIMQWQFHSTYDGCTNLVTGTDLQATSVGVRGCYYTYKSCTSLVKAPNISSITTISNGGLSAMFHGCSSLIYIKCLATSLYDDGDASHFATYNWVAGVSSTGTFIQAEGVTWPRGASGIPTGWVDIEKRTMPSGYKQLLQVTSNGTAYIQLSFGFEETDEVAATFSVDTSQTTDKYIVCPQTWNNNSNRYGMGVHNYGQYTAAFGNRSTGNTILAPRTSNDGELHNWTYAAATFAVTDKSCSINITGYTFGGITTNLRLFYGYNSNTKGAISSYKHIKGSTTACDFVAAIRESDNTAGLYDLANNEFMTCNGLTAGEEI